MQFVTTHLAPTKIFIINQPKDPDFAVYNITNKKNQPTVTNSSTDKPMVMNSFRRNNSSLLTIFTTFKNSPERLKIQLNTVKNWAQYLPLVQPVLFSTFDNKRFFKNISDFGWIIIEKTRTNSFSTPYLKDMYSKAIQINNGNSFFYGFSNGDILFDDGVIKTLNCIKKHFPDTVSLVVGQRSNFKVDLSKALFKSKSLKAIKAALFRQDAEDYFFISHANEYPWKSYKDVVIGRPGYDNYLVGKAIMDNITVIDATKTMKAFHQTGSEGNFAGSKNKDAHYNHKLLQGFPYGKGLTSRAQYFTKSYKNEIFVQKRIFPKKKSK